MDEDEDEEQVWKLPQLHESMEHLDGWRVEGGGLLCRCMEIYMCMKNIYKDMKQIFNPSLDLSSTDQRET